MSLAMMELQEIPALGGDPAVRVFEATDLELLATITGRPVAELVARWTGGHRAYIATSEGIPAAFGWVATRAATMGELGLTLRIGADERYLWNFVTLPAFRGRGIYPRLLQDIIATEASRGSERFWIAYAPENHASAAGIRKAGFSHVAELSFGAEGKAAVRLLAPELGARVAALLGVPETTGSLTPCWKCVRAGRGTMYCADGECACDYQRPAVECSEHVAS
ncbi:MAG TPA: GNAT family N-acetyltransferase [Gemmatimonadales bacterium]|nr:GNAT family N-acetyltransferase [Gemmatimonadales bacterium]